ncbi:22370_t:CDS:2, partial [Gigaspora margarita]
MANLRTEAKELSCLFKFLIGDYLESELAKCETLEKQKWWHADAPMVVNKAKALVNVKIPDILVSDPLPINPNSVENICKVFNHIQDISRINSGNQKWIVVVCDGLLYHYAQKFKNEYPSIILLPGPLYEEINMLKAFVELN